MSLSSLLYDFLKIKKNTKYIDNFNVKKDSKELANLFL